MGNWDPKWDPKLSNFMTFSISNQISVTLIPIFKFILSFEDMINASVVSEQKSYP